MTNSFQFLLAFIFIFTAIHCLVDFRLHTLGIPENDGDDEEMRAMNWSCGTNKTAKLAYQYTKMYCKPKALKGKLVRPKSKQYLLSGDQQMLPGSRPLLCISVGPKELR